MKWDSNTDLVGVKTVREHYTQLYANKTDNLADINEVLKKPKCHNLNSFITNKEIKSAEKEISKNI